MAANDVTFYIDIQNRRLVRDFFSNLEILPRDLLQGDQLNARIIGLEASPLGDPARPWRYVDLPTSIYLGIGDVGARPDLGTFTLTFGADTTGALSYAATAAQVATALNALASVISAGGVAVSGPDGGPYQVVFSSNGSRASITGNADLLYPLSSITVYESRPGTVDVPEIQVVVIDRQPAALAETFTAIAAPSIAVDTLQEGAAGVPEVQRVSLDATVHGGTWTLGFGGQSTAALAWNIAADELQDALEAVAAVGSGNVSVTGAFPEYIVTFQGTKTGNQAQLTASATGLLGPQGVEGTLALNTAGIEQLLSGAASVETRLEISATIGGAPFTLVQLPVTVKNDQIPNAPQSGTGMPSYYPVAEADATFVHQTATTVANAATDASTAHALNAVFSDTEVETALNALGAKYNALAAQLNALLAVARTAGLIVP